jgi:hypothetical protein
LRLSTTCAARRGGMPAETARQASRPPLGLVNWQMTQHTAFEMRNKTGSDVFIAVSTMAG